MIKETEMYDLYSPFFVSCIRHQNRLVAQARIDDMPNKTREHYIKRHYEQILKNCAMQQNHMYNRTKHK